MAIPIKKKDDAKEKEKDLTTENVARAKPPARAAESRLEPKGSNPTTDERALTETASIEPPGTASTADTNDLAQLFPNTELQEFRNQWDSIQTAFVDEPRRSVEEADKLVASAMKRLAEVFSNERSNLEKQWDRGSDVSTEDLRIALQRYRSFFHRLLSM